MDQRAVLAAFDDQLRRHARPSGASTTVEHDRGVVRYVSATPDGWSGVVFSELTPSTADAVIADQIRYFDARGGRFEWKYYRHDEPADLPDRLRAAGLVAEPEEAVMIAEIAELERHPVPAGIRFEEVTDLLGVQRMVEVHDAAFGGDHAALGEQLRDHLGQDTVAGVLAFDGERPVCASRAEFHPGTEFAGLWGGGTLPEWRGKGIYRAMVDHRARLAADRGYRYLQVDAMPDTSAPILRRLGFHQVATTIPFVPA